MLSISRFRCYIFSVPHDSARLSIGSGGPIQSALPKFPKSIPNTCYNSLHLFTHYDPMLKMPSPIFFQNQNFGTVIRAGLKQEFGTDVYIISDLQYRLKI